MSTEGEEGLGGDTSHAHHATRSAPIAILMDKGNCFLLDFSLYRVAKYLRMLGYSAVCDSSLRRSDLLGRAARDNLVLLTSSRTLFEQVEAYNRGLRRCRKTERQQRSVVAYDSDGESIYSSGDEFSEQREIVAYNISHNTKGTFFSHMVEIIRLLGLSYDQRRVFSRCLSCNEVLSSAAKETVKADVHPNVYEVYDTFTRCPKCRKVFWGVDSGDVVNYSAFRTVDLLQRLCRLAMAPEMGTTSIFHLRYFRCFPRAVHTRIFAHLTNEDIRNLYVVFPQLKDLSNILQERLKSTE
uniref:Uncharacterized protein TCIL3000_11_14320 n=1 Tax=Trypanosoma congolense (strain IL3000) TaxID=1068625 RepID=G0V2P5_TRYCI|nr:unnamed protein product [Trypanosoma congolense IL3000]